MADSSNQRSVLKAPILLGINCRKEELSGILQWCLSMWSVGLCLEVLQLHSGKSSV